MMISLNAATMMAKEVVHLPSGYSTLLTMAETMGLESRIIYYSESEDKKGVVRKKTEYYGVKFKSNITVGKIKKEIYDGLPELPITKTKVRA